MVAVLVAETARLAEQQRLDRLKTGTERNKCGQFATPPALALDIARHCRIVLRHKRGKFHFLDPAIGTGAFFGAFRQAFPKERIDTATGIELDKQFAATANTIWQRHGLRVIEGDFTKQEPKPVYDLILSNPPYVRHHHLSVAEKKRLGELAQSTTGIRLSGLAGLYCYFLLIGHAWLADDGLAAWLIPAEFMDVNYGREIKRYLTERVSLLQIHRFCPADVQFDDALVSSAVVVFEKRKPKAGHQAVFSYGGTLMAPANVETIPIDELSIAEKWSSRMRQGGKNQSRGLVTLGDLFTVKRGIATGNNAFFILPRAKLEELGIPSACVRPILPSPRFLKQELIDADPEGWPVLEQQLALIDCNLSEEDIRDNWPRFAAYLEAGKAQGAQDGYLTSRRVPWYSQERRAPAMFLCTYMGRSLERPFRFILNRSNATAANVYLLLYPKARLFDKMKDKAEEVLKALQAIHPEHFFDKGRVYGGGLYKMEPAELMRLPADALANLLGIKVSRQQSLF